TRVVPPGSLAFTTTVRPEPTAASAIRGSAIATVRTSSVELTTSPLPVGIRIRSRFWATAVPAHTASAASSKPPILSASLSFENGIECPPGSSQPERPAGSTGRIGYRGLADGAAANHPHLARLHGL